ncbi:winged helix domain-containing protein [Acidimangrovimonas sediminis]|uniref:winged helix domain-containing protein n=1 Tax=Acidimangrovimonas sediminis TaxID=2056283 RepID=UPI0038BB4956
MTTGTTRRGPTQYWVFDPDDKTTFTFTLQHSRMRDVLNALIQRGATGCNFYDAPAPPWASSVPRLRKVGLDIETIREEHGGEHPGHHARYILRSKVWAGPQGGTQ